jgi:prevent-host-death family protein
MNPVNIHEAKTHFSKLLARVAAGEEIVIAKAGKPIARLMPIGPGTPKKRVPGIDKGKIWMAKDFNSMSKRELDGWYRP